MGNKRIWELSSNRSNRAGAKIGKKDPGEKFGGEDEYNEKPVYYSQVIALTSESYPIALRLKDFCCQVHLPDNHVEHNRRDNAFQAPR